MIKVSMDRGNAIDLLDKDIDYVLQFCKWLFKPLGIWWLMSETNKTIYKFLSFSFIFINTSLMLFMFIPGGIYMITKEKDLSKRIILFGPIGFGSMNCIKYYIVIFKMKIVHQCLQHIKDDWKLVLSEKNRLKMYEYVKLGKRFMTFCTVVMYSGGVSYHTVIPFFLNVAPMIGNKTRRPHIYFGYDSIFDSQVTPTYEIVFFVHLVGSIITYTIALGACSLAALFASHICGQVDVLNALLDDLVSDTNQSSKESVDNQVAVIIKSHVRILRFSEMIEQMLREICLVEVLASTLIICVLEYYFLLVISTTLLEVIIIEWTNSETIVLVTYIVLIISLCSNIFIFCYIGEILQEQSASIGKSTYMINWYKLRGKSVLSLMLIIAMANYPLKITAGGMMNLNIRSFGSIIKTTLVYLNMLRTVTN